MVILFVHFLADTGSILVKLKKSLMIKFLQILKAPSPNQALMSPTPNPSDTIADVGLDKVGIKSLVGDVMALAAQRMVANANHVSFLILLPRIHLLAMVSFLG